jgi:hypothetical protein
MINNQAICFVFLKRLIEAYYFKSLLASISNHMANREKRLAPKNENMAANALMGGIDPINHHLYNSLAKRNTVKKENKKPKK